MPKNKNALSKVLSVISNHYLSFKKVSYLLMILLSFACESMAQKAGPFFRAIEPEDGMSNNKVNCILQDKRGFVWIGTQDGLNRFDGKYFAIFKNDPSDLSTVSGNKITDLYEDKSGILWIATSDGGLTKYNYHLPDTQKFKQFKYGPHISNGIPENTINKIREDRWGNLWLATSGSYVVRFNKRTEKFDTPVKTGSPSIISLLMDDNDTLRVGRTAGGLLKINTRTLQYKEDSRYNKPNSTLPHPSVTGIFRDKDRNLWYGSPDDMLYRQAADDQTESVYKHTKDTDHIPADEIVSFAEDKHMQIWMAGRNTGVTVYNKLTHQFTSYRHKFLAAGTLINDHVNVVYIDRQGIVWIGTNNGISTLNPLFFPFEQHFLPKKDKDIVVYDFYKDADHKLWIATSEGIFVQSPGMQSYEHRKITYNGQQLAVTKFFIDDDGTFYIGTDYTLFKYNPQLNTVSLLPNTMADPLMKKLVDSRVVSITSGTINNHHVLLVSPFGHYFTYYDFVEKKWASSGDTVQKAIKWFNSTDNQIRKIYKDKKENLWLATNKLGLGNWRQQDPAAIIFHTYDPKNSSSINNNDVFDIQEDKRGNFWITTYGGGLNYYNSGVHKFTHIQQSTNLNEGLQTDVHGSIWMICNGHLHKYDPLIKTYSCYDIPYLRVTDGIKGYIYKDSENVMYAGGENFYITFNPDHVTKIDNEPKTYLTDFKIFNKSYSHLLEKKLIELDHSQNYFSFEYSAPEFNGNNIEYSYMLEGVDKKWIGAGKRNLAIYSNLPAGRYVFKVAATNWNDSNVKSYISIVIYIKPPFWLKWWFYVLVVLGFFSISYFFYCYRIKEILKRQMIRNDIAQDLHDNIGSTLSSISVYSEVARIYQEQSNTAQLATVLNIIGVTSTKMVGEMGDIVWAINPKNDHLGSIVQRIKYYAQPLCMAKNIKFTIHADDRLLGLSLEMQVMKSFFLILKEAINNAIKYAECKNLTVNIQLFHSVVLLKITDDGIGFNREETFDDHSGSLSGNGLLNMQSRAAEIKADLIIHSKIGQGTSIELSFNI